MISRTGQTCVAILGGGLTGLSAAWHLKGEDHVLLEKEQIVGGLARTEEYEGFRFDLGSHIWFTKEPAAETLLECLPSLVMRGYDRSAWVHIYGRLVPAPFQANMYGMPADVVSECLIGYIEATRGYHRSRESFADWLRASFGDGLYKHFMRPYNSKVWTVPPEEMAADWTGSRVDVPDSREMIEGALGLQVNNMGPNARFCYPTREGIGSIAEAIYSQCSRISTGTQIGSIELDTKTIHLAGGADLAYQSMISTIPLPDLVGLIENVPHAVREAARKLRATKLVLVNIALKRRPDHGYHWIYFAEPKYPFFRVSFPHNYSESMCPAGCASIQAECAFPYDANIDETSVAEHAKAMLSEAGYLDISGLLFVKTRVVSPAYVIRDHARRMNLQIIQSYLGKHNVCCAGRLGAWEYINMDQCILAGRDAAAQVGSETRLETSAV